MKSLFDPMVLSRLHSQNRLVRSATWEGIAARDGTIDDNICQIYDELARGGVGVIITGFTSVSAEDHYIDGVMRLSDDSLIPQYKKLTDIIHEQGVPVISQLALGAFYRETINGRFRQAEPDDMTVHEIGQVRDQFIQFAAMTFPKLRSLPVNFTMMRICMGRFPASLRKRLMGDNVWLFDYFV